MNQLFDNIRNQVYTANADEEDYVNPEDGLL